MSKLPQHVENIPQDRIAVAPYNFVPLPEKAVPALPVDAEQRITADCVEAEFLVRHDQYFADRHTGTITCTLTTETPLYVRCGLSAADFGAMLELEAKKDKTSEEEQKLRAYKNNPDFFAPPEQRAVIPGSSLRGLFRSMIEIVSHSKIDLVTNKNLFYRSVDDTRLGNSYRERVNEKTIQAGFLNIDDDQATIQQCDWYSISRNILDNAQIRYRDNNKMALWNRQYQPIYIKLHGDIITECSLEPKDNFQEGIFVITGFMPINRDQSEKEAKDEFVFIPNSRTDIYTIPADMLDRFHDDDQLTQWQRQAFPRNQPANGNRKRDGWLLPHLQPVFFITDDIGEVEFFGRAQMFRLPYAQSPFDLIPEHLRTGGKGMPWVDMAEAMFGFVRQKKLASDHVQVYAGRLRFSHAHLEDADISADKLWLIPPQMPPLKPNILGSPKPTTIQHYLVQDQALFKDQSRSTNHGDIIQNYSDGVPNTIIRGHKQYWHHGMRKVDDLRYQPHPSKKVNETQFTAMRPVQSGVAFTFTISFENLSDAELGALLWTLRIADDERYRLKLGMGKPFGMGAIKIDHTIQLTNRVKRYQELFDTTTWISAASAITPEQIQTCVESFSKNVLDHSGERDNGYTAISEIPRIQHFLALLEWHDRFPDQEVFNGRDRQIDSVSWVEVVRYLEIERHTSKWSVGDKANEYIRRPVLPTPLGVLKRETPNVEQADNYQLKADELRGTITFAIKNKGTMSIKLDTQGEITCPIPAELAQEVTRNKRVIVRCLDNETYEVLKIL